MRERVEQSKGQLAKFTISKPIPVHTRAHQTIISNSASRHRQGAASSLTIRIRLGIAKCECECRSDAVCDMAVTLSCSSQSSKSQVSRWKGQRKNATRRQPAAGRALSMAYDFGPARNTILPQGIMEPYFR